eukprot:2955801-Prymnesium_polylepis.2
MSGTQCKTCLSPGSPEGPDALSARRCHWSSPLRARFRCERPSSVRFAARWEAADGRERHWAING